MLQLPINIAMENPALYMYYLLKMMENQTCYVSLVQVRIENLWKLKT